jgi:hypothetical protein
VFNKKYFKQEKIYIYIYIYVGEGGAVFKMLVKTGKHHDLFFLKKLNLKIASTFPSSSVPSGFILTGETFSLGYTHV